MYRTPPSTGTLGSTSYLIYGTTFSMYHPHSSASLPAIQLHPTPPNPHPPTGSPFPHTLLLPSIMAGAQTFMVSAHICPKHTPYIPNTPHTKSTSLTAVLSW